MNSNKLTGWTVTVTGELKVWWTIRYLWVCLVGWHGMRMNGLVMIPGCRVIHGSNRLRKSWGNLDCKEIEFIKLFFINSSVGFNWYCIVINLLYKHNKFSICLKWWSFLALLKNSAKPLSTTVRRWQLKLNLQGHRFSMFHVKILNQP